MILVAAGLLAGLVHVLSGPDHLAAVSLFSLDGRRRASFSGLYWGLGHSASVFVLSLLAFCFRGALPLNILRHWSEPFVGAILIALGGVGLVRALRWRSRASRAELEGHIPTQRSKAFLVGLVHGLAGGPHFLGILPALALPTLWASFHYLIAFNVGAVAAMVVFSFAIGSLSRGMTRLVSYQGILAGFSVIAMAVGGWWLAFPHP